MKMADLSRAGREQRIDTLDNELGAGETKHSFNWSESREGYEGG
jgi:hypothetical protein